jgi:hypothetical protein
MMYCWLIARADVLLKITGDDVLSMVNNNWGIATEMIYCWWLKITEVLMAVNRDDELLIVK